MAWEIAAQAIPAILSIGGTAAKAGGQYKGSVAQGSAQSQADYYRAAVARRNAEALDAAATRVVQAGEVTSDITGLRGAMSVGRAKASQAASGLDPNVGSAVDVRAGIAQAGRLDQLTTLDNAKLAGYGYRVRAAQERSQADIDVAEAQGATAGEGAGALSAGGTLLAGASALPFSWLRDLGGGGGGGQLPTGPFSPTGGGLD